MLAQLLTAFEVSSDVHRVLLALFTACHSPLHLLQGAANSLNPNVAVDVTGGIWARHVADENIVGDATLALHLYVAHLLLALREHLHLLQYSLLARRIR